MFARLHGTVFEKHPNLVILEAGGVGYEVHIPVWPEYRIALVAVVSQALHLFAAPAAFAFRAATGFAKRGADVADHAADAPIPDAAHTSGA